MFGRHSLEELRTDKSQQVREKLEEGGFQKNPAEGLEDGADQPRVGIVHSLFCFLFLLSLLFIFFSFFLLEREGKKQV